MKMKLFLFTWADVYENLCDQLEKSSTVRKAFDIGVYTQSMEGGATGAAGQVVQRHAEVEERPERDPAPIPNLLVGQSPVLAQSPCLRVVTHTHVQVS